MCTHASSRVGNNRYSWKTPYRDGTTHVIFEPLDFIARLAAPVPQDQFDPISSVYTAQTRANVFSGGGRAEEFIRRVVADRGIWESRLEAAPARWS